MKDISIKLPNGLISYLETFYEITSAIESTTHLSGSVSNKRQECQGRGGLYELAKELTDRFETKYKGREWDGDFHDTIEQFISDFL